MPEEEVEVLRLYGCPLLVPTIKRIKCTHSSVVLEQDKVEFCLAEPHAQKSRRKKTTKMRGQKQKTRGSLKGQEWTEPEEEEKGQDGMEQEEELKEKKKEEEVGRVSKGEKVEGSKEKKMTLDRRKPQGVPGKSEVTDRFPQGASEIGAEPESSYLPRNRQATLVTVLIRIGNVVRKFAEGVVSKSQVYSTIGTAVEKSEARDEEAESDDQERRQQEDKKEQRIGPGRRDERAPVVNQEVRKGSGAESRETEFYREVSSSGATEENKERKQEDAPAQVLVATEIEKSKKDDPEGDDSETPFCSGAAIIKERVN